MLEYTKTNNKEMASRKDWHSVDDKALEIEMTWAIKSHYKAKFPESSVYPLPVSQVYGADGQSFVQLDGMLVVKQARWFTELLLVEAKHKVTQDKIDDKQSKFQKLGKFLQCLHQEESDDGDNHPAFLSSKDALRRYCDCRVSWFIGGVSFNPSVMTYAQRKGFHVVHSSGMK